MGRQATITRPRLDPPRRGATRDTLSIGKLGRLGRALRQFVNVVHDLTSPSIGFHLKQPYNASKISAWTLHDLRRTFVTGFARIGVPIHVTDQLLSHVSGTTSGIVAVYQRHSYWTEQVAALKAWEDKVLSRARSG